MKRLLFGTLAFIIVSFATQAISHFGINADHYATVSFMRSEPIFALGFLTMLIQGLVLSHLFGIYGNNLYATKTGLVFGLLMSAFFVSYLALVEPSKYQVPNIGAWILVEGVVGLIQFSLFGVVLSLIYRRVG